MKKNSIKCHTIIFGLLFSFCLMGEDTYQYHVSFGEMLSGIVYRLFPGESLYGKNGKLNKVIQLNSNIKDKDIIFPNQIIILPVSNSKISKISEISEISEMKILNQPSENQSKNLNSEEIIKPASSERSVRVAALNGVRSINYTQKGILGSSSFNGVFFNYLKLNTDIVVDKWKYQFSFGTFKIKYHNSTTSIENSLYHFDFNLARELIFFNLGIQQIPILILTNGRGNFSKQSLVYFGAGIRKDIKINFTSPMDLILKSGINYFFKAIEQDSDLKSNQLSGYDLYGEANLQVGIFNIDGYKFFGNWINNINRENISQKIKWNSIDGKVESRMTSLSSTLGVLLYF